MAFFTKCITLHSPFNIHRSVNQILPQSSSDYANYAAPFHNFLLYPYPSYTGKRWLGTNAESSIHSEFAGSSAYDLLGVSETSSFAEIKASFRKLAKETHPDLARSHSDSSDASKKFIQILAAYEVKHMHWYEVGDRVSVCECRCSRARLPPSRFWLFEPRSAMHDIGGWYVETFGRNKKGRTVPSQRYWDGLDANEQLDKRVHPAMYLLALAYRTLDIENARRRKQTVKGIVEAKMFRVLSWCKRLV